MIHSLGLSETSPVPPPKSRLPADYYAAPADEVRPIFPKWVPRGCGIAAAVVLVIGFAIGAVVMHVGLGKLMAYLLDMSVAEIQPMIGKDVPPAQKQALNFELGQLSKNVESNKTNLARLEPVLDELKEAMDDKKITPAEAAQLTKLAHDANTPAPKPGQTRAPVLHTH
jgi:hypothetical protein